MMDIPWQIGKGIAMTALIVSTAWLEINGKDTDGLWIFIGLWIIFGSWG